MNRLYLATTFCRQTLLKDEALRALIGENIFPCVANDDVNGDFIVIRRSQYERGRVKQGITSNTIILEVSIVSEHYDRSIQIAEALDLCLESDVLFVEGEDYLYKLVGGTEDYEDYKYIQTLEYELTQI